MIFYRDDEVTTETVIDAYKRMGYKFFKSGSYDANIFSIRSGGRTTGKFDDLLGILYMDENNKWVLKKYEATTDPGAYYMQNPMNSSGCAILVPGQYIGSHKIGLHQGKYEALCQKSALKVYRDNNKDDILDFDDSTIQTGAGFGINIHRATANDGMASVQVGKWSAGCTVVAAKDDFDEFLSVCKIAEKKYGNSFTYTLFTEQQFFG